jgi:N-ethylmaleimide reductase
MANPDLVERFRVNGPLHILMGQETFYGGGAHGYTDYAEVGLREKMPV